MTEPAAQNPETAFRRSRQRTCAVAREVRPESDLLRFVAAPDGTVVPDIRSRLPGRGVWVEARRASVEEAVRRKVFSRGLKTQAVPPADLADQVSARLREAALGRLGLARKAGAVAAGFAKVEAAVGRDDLAGLLLASDAAEDGARKMAGAARRRFGGDLPMPLIRQFTSTELSLAMGLPNVIHAAVLQSPAGRSFVEAALRLLRFEGVDGSPSSFSAGDPPLTADDPQDEMHG